MAQTPWAALYLPLAERAPLPACALFWQSGSWSAPISSRLQFVHPHKLWITRGESGARLVENRPASAGWLTLMKS